LTALIRIETQTDVLTTDSAY